MKIIKNEITAGLISVLLVMIGAMHSLPRASTPENHSSDTLTEKQRDPVRLDDVIVKANRLPLTIADIPAAASVMRISTVEKSRYASAGDLIGSLPGFRAYPIGNIWGKTQIDVRGFYGGAQAEYLMVTYDGIPMNNIASGQVPWSIINFNDIDRMESISGPVSAQYGDFGFGGIIALYSPSSPDKYDFDLNLSAGSNNAWELHSRMATRTATLSGTAAYSKRRNDGWREHSRYEGDNVNIALDRSFGPRIRLSGNFAYGHSDELYPGALTNEELVDHRASAAFENGIDRPDYARIDDIRAGLSGTIELSDDLELKSLINVSSTQTREIVTITLPVRHEPDLLSTGGEISLRLRREIQDRSLHLIVGLRGEYGELDSDYFTFDETPSPSTIRNGDAYRRVIAGYVHGLYYPIDNFAVSAGLRFDNIWSRYHSNAASYSNEETAVSPKFALSMNLDRRFSLYGSVAAAFKAPTLVHLYDSPPLYYEFAPGTGQYFNISNEDLKAQTGTCYEMGIKFIDTIQTSGRLSVYDYEISNEIDFDMSTNQYMNIGRSRHLGIELEANKRFLSYLSSDLSLAYTTSTIRSGEFYGNQINGVPFVEYGWQISYDNPRYGYLSLKTNGRGHQHLDQANQRKLGEYHIWGFSAGTTLCDIDLDFTMRNIFDRKYNLDGYVGLADESRFYPAPGRIVELSMGRHF